ncbi:MAG: dephospho-CoA kinase [Bacteroidota bacterium]|nr:dephospho-CoA kinase [Bacteroidota bacterium]
MLKVGITGGIGSGKTTVAKVFSWLGIPIYNADEKSKFLLQDNEHIKNHVIEIFGNSIYPDGKLDRKTLGAMVFNDPRKLKQLESILHPAVRKDYTYWANENEKSPYTIKEAALLFEAGSYKELDLIIFVKAPLAVRLERVMSRDDLRADAVMSRINKQWPDEEKEKLSGYKILNDDSELVMLQVVNLHKKLLGMASKD